MVSASKTILDAAADTLKAKFSRRKNYAIHRRSQSAQPADRIALNIERSDDDDCDDDDVTDDEEQHQVQAHTQTRKELGYKHWRAKQSINHQDQDQHQYFNRDQDTTLPASCMRRSRSRRCRGVVFLPGNSENFAEILSGGLAQADAPEFGAQKSLTSESSVSTVRQSLSSSCSTTAPSTPAPHPEIEGLDEDEEEGEGEGEGEGENVQQRRSKRSTTKDYRRRAVLLRRSSESLDGEASVSSPSSGSSLKWGSRLLAKVRLSNDDRRRQWLKAMGVATPRRPHGRRGASASPAKALKPRPKTQPKPQPRPKPQPTTPLHSETEIEPEFQLPTQAQTPPSDKSKSKTRSASVDVGVSHESSQELAAPCKLPSPIHDGLVHHVVDTLLDCQDDEERYRQLRALLPGLDDSRLDALIDSTMPLALEVRCKRTTGAHSKRAPSLKLKDRLNPRKACSGKRRFSYEYA